MTAKDLALKSADDIKRIRECGLVLAGIFKALEAVDFCSATAWELDSFIDSCIVKKQARPAFKTIRGYDYASCISVNNEVVHGIPLKRKKFTTGDIVKIDIGVVMNGFFSDACRIFPVLPVSQTAEKLVMTAQHALDSAIARMVPGNTIGDLGHSIQTAAEFGGFSVVKHFSGHGTGFALHEPPVVPNWGMPGLGRPLVPGMVLAVEPIVNEGAADIVRLPDGWTSVTVDGKLSAHCEHTIAVTDAGPLILTG
ncbi:MAG TPA: type I methionyl aminopeptidase [Spirochaetota bacterium]|nr:type I methionyl aminopeptidase [Spirochaetota bacterium]HPI89996.1 type I methionyl aminopeptidase [Spirochaetota bacterium]HPR47280.1 type I methionyl aminopeptidase [Spirochaetota bacterium]